MVFDAGCRCVGAAFFTDLTGARSLVQQLVKKVCDESW